MDLGGNREETGRKLGGNWEESQCLALKKVDTKVNKNGKRKDKTEKKEIMPSNSGRGKD